MEHRTRNLGEFEAVATAFARALVPEATGATLVTLSGELGAGKTAFVKVVAKVLGVREEVTSPTFVLMKRYELPEASPRVGDASPIFARLVHIDAYRLKNGAELVPLRLDELLKDAGNLIMLEWPERVADVLPAPTVSISIKSLSDTERGITYG